MSAAKILLDDLTQGQWDWTPDASGAYVLTVDDDVVVNVREDSDASRLVFYASPGYLHCTWLAGLNEPWTAHSDSVDGESDVGYTVSVDPESGLVLLMWACPRAQVDNVRFREELERFVLVCRYWGSLLCAAPGEPELQPHSEANSGACSPARNRSGWVGAASGGF